MCAGDEVERIISFWEVSIGRRSSPGTAAMIGVMIMIVVVVRVMVRRRRRMRMRMMMVRRRRRRRMMSKERQVKIEDKQACKTNASYSEARGALLVCDLRRRIAVR